MMIRYGLTGLSAICGLASPALAVSQATLASGYSMVSSCSGINFGSFSQDGSAIGTSSATQSCSTVTSDTAGGTATTGTHSAGSVQGHAYANNSNATASVGTIHLYAENQGSTATALSGSQAMAGWNDTITIAGGTGQGIWTFGLAIDGMLASSGRGADTQFGIGIFKNHNAVQPYGAAINAAAFSLYQSLNAAGTAGDLDANTDRELIQARETDYGMPKSLTVNQMVYFAIPFTYGTAFSLGIFAQVAAGESSSGPYYGENVAIADFAHTIGWAGKGYVAAADGSGHATGFLLNSDSGFDYNIAAGVPEPASWMTMLLGFGLAGTAIRRRSRAVAA
jgi:hypothetical protein